MQQFKYLKQKINTTPQSLK